MSDHPMTVEEVKQAMAFARVCFAAFDERVSSILASNQAAQYEFELARALVAAKRIIGATETFKRVERTSKKPQRGLGYSLDEALIVASLPWHDDNLSAAVRAHFPGTDPEVVQVWARRIRERRQAIEQTQGDQPWETSRTWLGDLIDE